MASIQGVIFDMDGLMFDTEPVWGACWTLVCAKVGLEVPDGMVEAVRGRSGETMIATVREYLGPDAPVEWLWEQEKEAVRETIEREGVSKKGGLDELLTYLHDCQIPAAVASSSPKAQIEANLARHGITGYFDVIVSGDASRDRTQAHDRARGCPHGRRGRLAWRLHHHHGARPHASGREGEAQGDGDRRSPRRRDRPHRGGQARLRTCRWGTPRPERSLDGSPVRAVAAGDPFG